MRFHWILVVALVGCGSTTKAIGGNDVEPEKIEGGGATGGHIDGRLNVYVFDGDTDEPVEGATVLVGDGTDPDLVGETDGDGLVVLQSGGLEGPVDLTIGRSGYVTATIVGLDAANFTSGLDPVGDPPRVDTATIRGTVPGVADLPASTLGDAYGAFVSFAIPKEEERQDVEQPPGDENVVLHGVGPQTYSLRVPEGELTLVAYLVHVTNPGKDDAEIEYLSLGLRRGITVVGGEELDDVEIPTVADMSETLEVDWPSPVDGTDEVRGIAGIDLGEEGLILFFQPQDPAPSGFDVPPLADELASGSYILHAAAVDSARQEAADGDPDANLLVPSSTRMLRFEDAANVPTIPAFLELPRGLSGSGRTFSFDPVSGVSVHTIGLRAPGTDENAWAIVTLDGTLGEFTLPDLPAGLPDLPANDIDMRVTAVAIDGFDPQEFEVEALQDEVRAASHSGTEISP